jgi:hypothetical protein
MGRSRRTFFAPTSHESKLVAKKVEEEKHIFITFSSLNIFMRRRYLEREKNSKNLKLYKQKRGPRKSNEFCYASRPLGALTADVNEFGGYL